MKVQIAVPVRTVYFVQLLSWLFGMACCVSNYAADNGSDDFEINVGLSGAWYTPEFSGQGFLIDVISSRSDLFLTWFTYRSIDDETPANDLVADEQRWYVAEGGYQGHSGVLKLFSTSGGRFNAGRAVVLNEEGTLTVQFANCKEGVVEVAFLGAETPVEFPIERLTPDINCVRLVPSP